MKSKSRFLKWTLINVLFVIFLIVTAITYNGHIPALADLAIGVVLLTYAIASALLGIELWHTDDKHRVYVRVPFVGEAIRLLPMMAMLGTVSGFLVALGGSASDVQHRVSGASTSLSATFIGIAATILLKIQHYVFTDRDS